MNILIVDNYDSFVYNIYHFLDLFDVATIDVVKNDKICLEQVNEYDKIVLSPGPGLPKDAGKMLELLKRYDSKKSILGICLGHQAIVEHYGGKLINMQHPLHGISNEITIEGKDYLFNDIPSKIEVGHYHSWVAKAPLPDLLEVTSTDQLGHIMSIKHKVYDIRGVQFHPESILTPHGKQILKQWILKTPDTIHQ